MVWSSDHNWHKRNSWLLSTYKCDSKSLQKAWIRHLGVHAINSIFGFGFFFASTVVTTKKYLLCVMFLTLVTVYLPLCVSSEQPILSLECKGLFLQDHPQLSLLIFIPWKVIGLVARKTFELSDFTHLQFREPTGILDEDLTVSKLNCFFLQITGLQRMGKNYI